MIAYFNGNFLGLDKISISPFDRGFQFSDGIYEVIRYYPSGFFEFDTHINRLKNSLLQIGISNVKADSFRIILDKLIKINSLEDEFSIGYIQITRGVQFPRRHYFSGQSSPTIFIYVEKLAQNNDVQINGVSVGLEEDMRWGRCNIKSIALLANVMAKQRAVENGLYEIIMHRSGIITEGTHSNVAFVKNNSIITPPLSNFILPGITRKVVLEICRTKNLRYEERNVYIEEIDSMNECFIMATTTEITPVIRLASSKFGGGHPGTITLSLQKEFKKQTLR